MHDGDFEDLVTTVHLVASELQSRGFGPQLLAAVFPFERKGFDGGRVYWIYGFKRGAFWPFVPKGDGKERDNAEELELKAKLEQELPIEQDLSRWFARLRRAGLASRAEACGRTGTLPARTRHRHARECPVRSQRAAGGTSLPTQWVGRARVNL